ncbi:MAG: phytanoyl-CoA dioxygenase family protein [Chloroflexota bacterium]
MMTGFESLPQPTTDLNTATANLDKYGYCLIANALSQDQVAALKTRMVEQAEAEMQAGVAIQDGGPKGGPPINQRLTMLVNKGRVFREMLFAPAVRAVIDHALGEEYLLHSHTANIAKPGGVAMGLHTDQWWMPVPIPRDQEANPVGSMTRARPNIEAVEPIETLPPRACVNVMWMINDFSPENGGTRLVPGSHLYGRRPYKPEDKQADSIGATGPAGTAMVFDGRAWHGTGANISDGPRLGLLTTFIGPQFRPQENYTVGLAPEVYEEASPELLALLGFKIWYGYGRLDRGGDAFISRQQQTLGEMKPE